MGAVAPPPAAAIDLTGDRGVRATEGPADGSGRATASDPARDLLALGERQTPLGSSTSPRADAAQPRQVVAHRHRREPDPVADLSLTQALCSQLPDPVLLHLG